MRVVVVLSLVLSGLSSAQNCPPGQAGTPCAQCPLGQFQDQANQATCTSTCRKDSRCWSCGSKSATAT
jgi:hypothetical protein